MQRFLKTTPQNKTKYYIDIDEKKVSFWSINLRGVFRYALNKDYHSKEYIEEKGFKVLSPMEYL